MPRLNIHLETSGNEEKLLLGPIIFPRPGPTLEMEVAAPEIEVTKSNQFKFNSAVIVKNIRI